MSSPEPEQNQPQNVEAEAEAPAEQEQMSAEEQETYNKMMATLTQMNTKIEHVKKRLHNDPIDNKKHKTDQMTDKLIQSKESSEIITKENLLSDITESYEKAVIEVYSENSKLKKRIQQMAKLVKEQNAKIYAHTKREKELVAQNEQLRSEVAKLKDEKLMLARGHVPNQNSQREEIKRKQTQQSTTQNQNEDFDFWSMPQNEYGKKKKDFVQDSNLWVNQKEHQQVFLTENVPQGSLEKNIITSKQRSVVPPKKKNHN